MATSTSTVYSGTAADSRCGPGGHWWPARVGDPVPETAWHGQRCRCGEKVLVACTCSCGHTHMKTI